MMRDNRFVAVHRGGPLTKDHHHQLIRWARECSEHVLSLIDENIDQRLIHALYVAKEWEKEKGKIWGQVLQYNKMGKGNSFQYVCQCRHAILAP